MPGATLYSSKSAARTLLRTVADPKRGFVEKLFAEDGAALQRYFYRLPGSVLRVTTGYVVRIDSGSASPEPVAVNLDQALAWLQHKIVFEHRPLGEVAAEFNRYGSIPVETDDEELQVLPVRGMF